MIRYPVTLGELRRRITAIDASWHNEAAARTAAFRLAGEYNDDLPIPATGGGTKKASAIWSIVKPVYMALQHDKCAYCERQLSSEEWGRGEHDLEHYRPKKSAKPWKIPQSIEDDGFELTQPLSGSKDPGYHLLAYHLLNYCAACKTCNSGLKSNYFPIEGPRNSMGENPRQMRGEKALLLYPLSNVDPDPEGLIDFHGLSPRAKGTRGFKRRRALVTIEFFQLGSPARKELFRERARQLTAVYSFLVNKETSGSDIWDLLIEVYRDSKSPHSSCTRSFTRLFERDRAEADEIFDLCSLYLGSIST